MKKKYWIIGILIILTAGMLFYLCGSDDNAPGDDTNSDEKEKISQLHSLFQFMSADKENQPVQEFDPNNVNTYEIEQASIIKEVIVEKNPVCVNEDFLVRVIAKNPNGPDEHLVYRIQNKMGNPAILRFTKAGSKEFYVVVRDEGKHIDFKKVEITVRDCPGNASIILSGKLHPLKAETAEFEVISQEGLAGKCIYEWDFGDNKHKKTTTGYVEHSYATRDQTSLQSSFMVTVKITDSMNTTATARTTVSFPNIHYLSKLMGSAVLPVVYDPFPKVTMNDIQVDTIMKNIFEEPITFTSADLEIKPCNSSMVSDHLQLSATDIMNTATIAPGATIQQVLRIKGSLLPPYTCNVNINLQGKFASNEDGSAKLYLNIPPKSKDNIDPNRDKVIEDNEMIRKLNKAAEILGKDKPITPADINKLEREGKL